MMKQKLFLKISLLIVFILSINSIAAQTLYWTNSTGNNRWSIPANWSADNPSVVTTPAPAVSPPTASTDVIFNAGSFKTATNHIINLDLAVQAKSIFVLSIGAANQVTVNGGGILSVFGGIQLLPETSKFFYNGTGNLILKSNSMGNILDMKGQNLETTVQFDGVGGGWQFLTPVNTNSSKGINVLRGSVDFHGLTYNIGNFSSSTGGTARAIDFGNSNFNISSNTWNISNAGLISLAGKPNINFLNPSTFYHQNTGLTNFHYGSITMANGAGITFLLNNGNSNESDIEEFNGYDILLSGGTNTVIKNLNLNYGYTGSLQGRRIVVDKLSFIGGNTCDLYHFTGGSIAFTNLSAQLQPIDRLWLNSTTAQIPNGSGGYIIASPLVQVSNGKDDGGNAGWNISSITGRSLYWIGNSGEWHNPLNWSLTSGGVSLGASGCPPNITDNVFFDANSFNANNQVMTIGTSTDAYCNNMTWAGLDQTGIDWQGTKSLNLGGDITLDPGMTEFISYNQQIKFYDKVEARVDFKNDSQNRKMSNVTFYVQDQGKVNQVSNLVYISIMTMDRNTARVYNVGGAGHTLQVKDGLRENGTIRMNDATIINEGTGLAVYYSINLIFNANSVWKATAPGTIQYRFVTNNFPTFIQTDPAGVLNFQNQGSSLHVQGNLTVNGKINDIGSATVTGTMKLSDNTHQFSDGATITVGYLDAAGDNCGIAPKIKSLSGGQFNLNVPNGNVLSNYAGFSDIKYTGNAAHLNLNGQGTLNVGNNTNIDFGLPVENTFYWRPNSDDNTYTGNWTNPRYWALNQSDVFGQSSSTGCIPTINDKVVFDKLSGNGSSMTVTINDGRGAKSVEWIDSGADAIPNNMNFLITSTGSLDIKEKISLGSNMTPSFGGALNFLGTINEDVLVDLKNKTIGGMFIVSSGNVRLQNGFLGGARIKVNGGAFITNGKNITAATLWSVNTQSRKIDLTNSSVTLTATEQYPGALAGDPRYTWNIQNSVGNLDFISTNSIINIKGNFNPNGSGGSYFLGDGLAYKDILFSSADGTDNYSLEFLGNNTVAGILSVQGTLNARQSFTVNNLNLKTDRNHVFSAGQTTTFLPTGNIEKNGDLSAILNLRSSNSPTLHNFVKQSGGNIFICNIGIIDIQATGVPFKTNSVSTYNGLAGAAANPPAGTSWDFNSATAPAQITLTDPSDVHINLGDEAKIGYEITLNNTGPYQTVINLLGVATSFTTLSSGNATTTGNFILTPSATGDAVVNNFSYFDCPGQYDPGTVIDGITPIKVPPVNINGLALNGETETYPFSNLPNKIFVMNEADRLTNVATFANRKTQVRIQDKVDASDTQSLNNVKVTTHIDVAEINFSSKVYAKRRWELATTGAGGAIVRFYITQAELTSLKTAVNNTGSDLDFLASLSVFRFNSGVTPSAGQVNTEQQMLSSGIAAELADGTNTYYYVEAKLSGFSGSYALGAALNLCYKPAASTGITLSTKAGITSLGRAGANDENWPMVRKGGWIALESKTKALVINRVSFNSSNNPVGIASADFVEGMMVYDTTNNCLKLYTSVDNGITFGWYCLNTQTCPD
ncbi:beta strand repeat-containing protein [Chryseobacterium vaccae]|uniref:beta strand repeat-containing protein n=1 Tax=Chryseobacterium vaccae TaxID=2604424 RepID=UPI0012962022|nr:hypothetical protein [Chryseobacterium vaccae]